METGCIVEFIDREKIVCAVVLEVKNERLRLLTEANREVNVSSRRLSHKSQLRLDISMGRHQLTDTLKHIALRREEAAADVDPKEVWEVLSSEQEWVDLATMTALCFPGSPGPDFESAVVRAFFRNRRYFKFGSDSFLPYTEEQVEQLAARQREEARRRRIIDQGSAWLKKVVEGLPNRWVPHVTGDQKAVVDLLRSYHLYEKDCPHFGLSRALAAAAGLENPHKRFQVLVAVGEFDADENVDLLRHHISVDFPEAVIRSADRLVADPPRFSDTSKRRDLTHLRIMTIDGQATLDYDDAISVERAPDGTRLGIHIVDVGYFVAKGSLVDVEARERASSIYMPDQRVSMLPSALAEGVCSLKEGEFRPAISTIIHFNDNHDIVGWDVVPSVIRVRHQYTYYDVNLLADEDPDVQKARKIAERFRQFRLSNGAIQITLPDIGVWMGESGDVNVSRVNRESPSRMLVSEFMIMANWLMAQFLSRRAVPAIFRSQPPPRERLYNGEEGSLFQNWMQRRLLSRFVLSTAAEHHSGLGLEAYTTATSPIRKYGDLITQRQIRSVFGLETPYSQEEMAEIIQGLQPPMAAVSKIQSSRNRYWLLKYLETKVGERESAVVLARRRNHYQVLLTDYMIEVDIPVSAGLNLKPEDIIHVTLQNVDARKDIIAAFAS
jgi:exoribonuclease-2